MHGFSILNITTSVCMLEARRMVAVDMVFQLADNEDTFLLKDSVAPLPLCSYRASTS